MKIVLIFSRKVTKESSIPPFGIMYLAAMLRKHEYNDIKLFDMALANEEEIIKECLAFMPDIIGLSSDSISFDRGAELLRALKGQCINAKYIVGGIHATIDPEGVLHNTGADIAIIGEGESTIVDVVKCFEKNSDFGNIAGIAYIDEGKFVVTPTREFIEDLDAIPFPARDLLPMQRYLDVVPDIPMLYPTMPLIASRGCKANCIYCQPVARKLFGKKMRCRSVDNVMEEIKYLKKNYKFKALYFIDDELLFNGREWIEQLCNELILSKLNIKWTCQARVDQIDEDLLVLMKRSGCYAIGFGVESGSQKILNFMRKGYKVEQIHKAFDLCRKYRIITTCNFMVGTPGETLETVQDSLDLISRISPNLIRCSITTPTPGSDLHDCMEKEDRINIKKLSDFDRWASYPIRLDGFSQDDIERAVKQIVGMFYSQFFSIFYNPRRFIENWYFIRILILRYLQLLSHPGLFFKDIVFYLQYSRHRKGK